MTQSKEKQFYQVEKKKFGKNRNAECFVLDDGDFYLFQFFFDN